MERFYFSDELKDSLKENSEKYVVDMPSFADGVLFNAALGMQVVKNDVNTAVKMLRVAQITDVDDVPEHVIASYKYDLDIITKQKYIRENSYVVYYENSKYYANLTSPKTAAVLISAAEKKNHSRNFYAVSNDIFPKMPIWSVAIKNAYMEKYGEDITEKLLMLFFTTSGSERFRYRYYSLVGDLIRENFIEGIKSIAHQSRVKFYGFTDCGMDITKQLFPNINSIGFADCFDRVFLECPKEIRMDGFLRKYIRYYINADSKRLVAGISYEDFCLLSLPALKLFADRLIASGIKYISIGTGIQNEVLRKKRKLLSEYITTLCTALDLGKKHDDCLVVYPLCSAMGEYEIGNPDKIKSFSDVLEGEITLLNQAHVLYDVANENQLGGIVKISGALVSARGKTYTGLILLSCNNILPKTAGFIMKYVENGGRVYSVGALPDKIDGFKSKKAEELAEIIRPVKKGGFSVLRRSGNPVFADGEIDLYAVSLAKNRMLYLAANIKGGKASFATFDDILRMDTVSFNEQPCVLSNKIGKVMGKQIIDLDNNYLGTTLFITGKAQNAENLSDYDENLQISPYFDLKNSDANTLVLNKCSVRAGYHKLNNTTVFKALKKLAGYRNLNSVEFVFPFEISNMDETAAVALYFKNQEKFTVTVNGSQVCMERGEQLEITEFLRTGDNEITVSADNFGAALQRDANAFSNLLLRGNFSVIAKATVRSEKNSVNTRNDFAISVMPSAVSLERILESGFWFFSGSMELVQKFYMEKQFEKRYFFGLKWFYGLAIELFVNGTRVGDMYLPPYSFDITKYLENGENEIRLVVFANQMNVRTLQGDAGEELDFEPFGAKILANNNDTALIQATGVSKSFGEANALNSVEFSVNHGEFAVIYGEEGSGKSTLINILGGMERADSGSITVDETEINTLGEIALSGYRRRDIAIIYSGGNLIDGYSVADNLELACDKKIQVIDISLALRSVGMGSRGNEKVSKLSAFEQQKVAVARALVKNPQIILCDDPTLNLDAAQTKQILHLLHETCKLTEKTVIVATDNPAVCDMADRVIRLREGKVVDESVNTMPTPLERIEF